MFQLELLATTNDNARSADTMHKLDNICIIIPKRSMVHTIHLSYPVSCLYTIDLIEQISRYLKKMRDKLYLQYKEYYVLNLIEERV